MIDESSPPRGLPASSASPAGNGNSPRTPTGRPPRWNLSTERKISRLYVYTTLPVQKIIDVIHAKSPETAPGKDSANKKLNALLDKEPRWLHPRTDSDMSRRLNELSHSPSRSTASRPFSISRPHAASDPMPYLSVETNLKRETGTSPTTLEVPRFHQFPTSTAPSTAPALSQFPNVQGTFSVPRQRHGSVTEQGDGSAFARFLRQTTFMSSSTDGTTGSFHRALAGYSEPYVQTVKRLVKRFTAPITPRGNSMSPISEDITFVPSWVLDEDAPNALPTRPHILPGDFLSLDQLLQQHPPCFPEAEQHKKRSCLCYVKSEVGDSPWITEETLNPTAQWLLQNGLIRAELGTRDSFDNTILHLLAARGVHIRLAEAIQSGKCDPILNCTNTAGQTFLHVLCPTWFVNPSDLRHLLALLYTKGMDIYARDNYGRNIFHILIAEDVSTHDVNSFLQDCDRELYAKRDAFGLIPELHSAPNYAFGRTNTQAMDLDPPQSGSGYSSSSQMDQETAVQEEVRLLELVRVGQQDARCEDSRGRNGLHCLAMVALSDRAVALKYGVDRRRKDQDAKNPDASTERLKLRHSLAEGLLDAGVDPNHYDNDGNTPLMAFAAQLPEDDDYKTGPKILELLIQKGANLHARNRGGETALHIAVRCGRKLAMRTLVNCGANVHVRDADGRSLLEVADVKMRGARAESPKEYAHFEACRAWLSGKGLAVQEPTVRQEWARVTV